MPQNIYDSASFFTSYSQLPRSLHGLDGAPEWPSLEALLPIANSSTTRNDSSLQNLHVLDLGCGFGWFTRYAILHGASSALSIDISSNMLARAHEMTDGKDEFAGKIEYLRGDLDELGSILENYFKGENKEAKFDLVFSSLAVHYLSNLDAVVKTVYQVLKHGGDFVFSAEHPIYTAPMRPGFLSPSSPSATDGNLTSTASTTDTDGPNKHHAEGARYWPLDSYQLQGPRVTNWLADGVVKQHRTVGTYLNILLDAGFQITGFEEWCPTRLQLEEHPEWGDELVRPTFMLVRARKA